MLIIASIDRLLTHYYIEGEHFIGCRYFCKQKPIKENTGCSTLDKIRSHMRGKWDWWKMTKHGNLKE